MTENEPQHAPGPVPGAQPPASSTPGMIPGAAPPTPTGPPMPYSPRDATGTPLQSPTGLSNVLIGTSAAFTVVMVVLASFAQQDVDRVREAIESGSVAITPTMLVSFTTLPLLVVSYITYGMWMSRMRANRSALGRAVGPPALEWWGWFVPFASIVLVPFGARRVTGRAASLGVLLGWWIAWQAGQAAYAASNFAINAALDIRTGDLVRPELLDLHAPLMWASAAMTIVSWGFFLVFIRRTTAHHLEV